MITSCDDRRLALFDIFGVFTPGQVNIVHLRRDAVSAWHRHQKQTDHYFCVSGAVRVGVIFETDGADGSIAEALRHFYVLDAKNPHTLTVHPNQWHGYQSLTDEAVLLQYLTQKYNPDDEERHAVDAEMPWITH